MSNIFRWLSHLSVEAIPQSVGTIRIDFVFEISFKSSPSEWIWMQERNSIMGCMKGSLKKINFKRKPCRWSCTQGSFPCHCGKAPWSKQTSLKHGNVSFAICSMLVSTWIKYFRRRRKNGHLSWVTARPKLVSLFFGITTSNCSKLFKEETHY